MSDVELERVFTISPAFDKRHTDPNKNYGIHGATMRWVLKGREGVVQFVLHTNWQLPHVRAELDAKTTDPRYPHLLCHPMPADLGYHAKMPRYESQTKIDCEYVEGGCYYDGSSLNAEPVFNRMLADGGEAVWAELSDYYKLIFPEGTMTARAAGEQR